MTLLDCLSWCFPCARPPPRISALCCPFESYRCFRKSFRDETCIGKLCKTAQFTATFLTLKHNIFYWNSLSCVTQVGFPWRQQAATLRVLVSWAKFGHLASSAVWQPVFAFYFKDASQCCKVLLLFDWSFFAATLQWMVIFARMWHPRRQTPLSGETIISLVSIARGGDQRAPH